MLEGAVNSESSLAPLTLKEPFDVLPDDRVIDWEEDEPATPMNWSAGKKWTHVVLVSLLALAVNMGPTICAAGIGQIVQDFSIDSEIISTLSLTIYILGLALGPMLIAPIGELYGRLPVYHIANTLFLVFLVATAVSKTLAQFMVFRFISGCFGGVPMSLGGGTIADLIPPAKRPQAMALFSLGPLCGPTFAPLIGGFITGGVGWRWTFWVLLIFSGAIQVGCIVFMRETHPKVLLERKTAKLRMSSGNPHLQSAFAKDSVSPRQLLFQALVRPTMLLFRSPILLVIALYVALVFSVIYILLTTITPVFEGQYGFTTTVSGLAYTGALLSMLLGMVVFKFVGPRVTKARMVADKVPAPKPEYQLLLMIWFSPLVGLGLFFYGWTVEYRVHWIVPIIATVFIGFGAYFVIMPAQLYLVQLFGSAGAASALAAATLLRYICSTFLPLAAPSLYQSLDYGWGNSLLGFLALAFLPFPLAFYKYGEKLRAKTKVKM